MEVGALVLTGGGSRRMGRDKATLRLGDRTLAERTAAVLLEADLTGPLLEVGPGVSGLEAVPDAVAGAGPLAAVATGAATFRAAGFAGPAVVVATDLPHLSPGLVSWLAGHPADGSVVPVHDARVQWLCARYSPEALDRAGALVAAGRSAVRELAGSTSLHLAGPEEWLVPAGGAGALDDLDTPDDLARVAAGPRP